MARSSHCLLVPLAAHALSAVLSLEQLPWLAAVRAHLYRVGVVGRLVGQSGKAVAQLVPRVGLWRPACMPAGCFWHSHIMQCLLQASGHLVLRQVTFLRHLYQMLVVGGTPSLGLAA
jgi:hypothetical protein